MDYKQMLDSFMQIACVLSVDMSNPEDSDSYVILDANDAYMASVGRDRSNFKVNVPYTDYIRIDKNFEMMCESCVKTGQPVHAYVDAAFYNSWMDIYMLPVKSDKEGEYRTVRQKVETGRLFGTDLAVKSGLARGDRIAVAGVTILTEGQTVTLYGE